MRSLFFKLLLTTLFLTQIISANEYLAETIEIKFTPELKNLAQELEYNPVKIYNWVYNNIEFEDYDGSRKNALSTFWTKRGNEWDQTSLLIALMRISSIEARYVKDDRYKNDVLAEIYVDMENYRGAGDTNHKTWVKLAPWEKEYTIDEGIDLFPNQTIPDELNFNFDEYLKTIKQETALELFEKQLQEYLNKYYQGKSLKDVPYKKKIVKKDSLILPLSLPKSIAGYTLNNRFSDIGNKDRIQTKIYIKRYGTDEVIMEQTIYLPEIATSRLVVDFLPYSDADKKIIEQYGLITKTPEGKANVKAVLRLDGKIIKESSSLKTGEFFVYGYMKEDEEKDRPKKLSGTLLTLTFDIFQVSLQYISKLKDELNGVSIEVLKNDYTKEEYLGRYGYIMNSQYQYRSFKNIEYSGQLLHIKRNLTNSIQPTLIYTSFDKIDPSYDEKYLIHNSWNIDASISLGGEKKIETNNSIGFKSEFGTFSSNTFMYGASYMEGVIFEDWQSTPSGNSIKALMVANEQGIPIVKLSKKDIVNGHIPILENQIIDRYSDYQIKDHINNILNDNAIVTTPVRKVRYEGLVMSVSLTFTDRYMAYFFNMNHGGGSSNTTIPDTSLETTNLDSLKSQSTASMIDLSTYSDASDASNSISFSSSNILGADISADGDPVDMVKGEFYQNETPDISIKSRGFNLEIKRTYKSQSIYNGIFGYGWTWDHMEMMLFGVGGSIIYFDENGVPVNISKNNDGTFNYPPGSTYTIKEESAKYTLIDKDNSKKIFSKNGLLIKKEDPYGNFLEFTYNDNSRLEQITDAIGRALYLEYNANNKVSKVKDFLGNEVSYIYDGDDLVSFTNLAGQTTKYEYLKNQDNPKNNHNMSKYVLPNGDYLKISYYKNDQVSHHTNKKDETFQFQYSRYNQYSETWNEDGYYRKVFFNDQNDVVRVNTKDGTIELKEYDQNHNMISQTDANGYISTYTYDEKRNMLSKTNAMGEKWTYEYDSRHNKKTKEVDPLGNITQYVYDDNGNLLEKVDSLGNITKYQYDNYGNKIKTIDSLNSEYKKVYDEFGINVTKTIDKNNNVTEYSYDQIGNQTVIQDANNGIKSFTYTKDNKKAAMIDALGNKTSYEYTQNGQLQATVLPNGAKHEKTYDIARDIVTKSLVKEDIDPFGNSIKYSYDKVGNKIEQIDKRGNKYTFTYDALKRMTSKTDPHDNTTYYTYDGNGKIIKEKMRRLVDYNLEDVITTYAYDKASRLIEKISPNGLTVKYTYNKLGKKTTQSYVINGTDIITKFEYDDAQRVIKVIQGYGSISERITTHEYDKLGRKVKEINPLGYITTFAYDKNSNLLTKTLDGKVLAQYSYDKLNRAKTMTDANGNITTYEYDANSQKTAMIDAKGNRYRYIYDEVGNMIEEISPLGISKRYEYNLLNKPIKIIDGKNNTQYLSYDENQNMTEMLDAKGNRTQYFYDELNRKAVVVDPNGDKITIEYDEVGNLIAQTDKANSTVKYKYDIANNMIEKINITNENSIIQKYQYDRLNRIISIFDPNENKTTFSYSIYNDQLSSTNANGDTTYKMYDKLGRVVQTTDAKDIVSKIEYNNLSKPIKVTQGYSTLDEIITQYTYDNIGNKISEIKDSIVTTYSYDKLNNLVKTTIGGITTKNIYDKDNNLIQTIDGNSNVIEYKYDVNKNIMEKQLNNGEIYRYSYDKNNNLISQLSPQGRVKQFNYNALNQRVKYIEDNAIKEVKYHKNGKVEEEIDFNGVITKYTYDELQRVIEKIEAKGTAEETITKYTYDKASNLIAMTNAKGVKVYYEYNSLNQKIKKINSDNSIIQFEYDENSNLVKQINEDNVVVEYQYDTLNRKTQTLVDGTKEQEYTYDRLSRLTSSIDYNQGIKTNKVEYSYDSLNNIINETQNGYSIDKEFDNNSNQLTLKVDDTLIQTNSYNSQNKLVAINDIANFSYDKDDMLTTVSYNNGITNTILIDSRDREKKREYKLDSNTLYSQETKYDSNSNIVKENIFKQNQTIIKEYNYDSLERITEDIYNNHLYQYDKVGNQIFTTQNGINEYREVNLDNQYTSITNTNIEYDQKGNIISYNDKEFVYDYLNRLIELKKDGNTIATYTYDAQNRRVSKTVNLNTTTYIYNNNQVIQEYENNSLTNSYIYASYIDDPIAYIYNGNTYYYIKDRQYSIQAVTDSSGNIVERYSYNAFGIMTMKDANQNVILKSNVNNSITYTGRRYDSESGMYYYRNRMYSSELGRFLQRDPKGYVDGMNLYAYVKNNPLKYLDAMGTTSITITNTKSDGIIGTVAGWYSNIAENFSNNGTETHQNRLSTKFLGIGGVVVGKMKLGYDLITSTSLRDVARVAVVTTAGGVAGVAAGTAAATGSILLGVSAPVAPYVGVAAGLWAGENASGYAGKTFDKYF